MTASQAQSFYCNLQRADFLALQQRGWSVEPHLRLGFVRGHELMVLYGTLAPEAYLNYWMAPEHRPGRRYVETPEDKRALFEELQRAGLASEEDRPDYDREVMNTARSFVDLGPGFSVVDQWSLAEATMLDSSKRMPTEIRNSIARALTTWGQTLPPGELPMA
jgi:hypothetical protein